VKRLERASAARGIGCDLRARRALKSRCDELLRQAEARVEKITLDAAGKRGNRATRRELIARPAIGGQIATIGL